MKRYTYIALILTLVLLLTGCAPVAAPSLPTNPTGRQPTSVSASPVTEPTNAVVRDPVITSFDISVIDDNEKCRDYLVNQYWYLRALSCTFEKPEDIAAEYFFYNGLAPADQLAHTELTNEERAFLFNKWSDKYGSTPWLNAVKMPVKKINEALSVFGVAVQDIKIPENWVYYDKTDSYYAYRTHTDAFTVTGVTVTDIKRNGIYDIVKIYWKTQQSHTNTATGETWPEGMEMVMTLEKQNNNWVIAANAPNVYSPKAFSDLNTVQDFDIFLREEYWYWRALGCTFETPKDISAEHYFYNGLAPSDRQHSHTFTDEEKAFLEDKLGDKYGQRCWTNAIKLPVLYINQALEILNVTVEDIGIPDNWVYYPKTDSYYVWRSDAYSVVGVTITDVVKNAETAKVYWTVTQKHLNTATGEYLFNGTKMVMTLQEKEDGTCCIVSNVPTETQDMTTKEYFENLLKHDSWYFRALCCTFEKTQDISVRHYFYNGLLAGASQTEDTFSDEEWNWIKSQDFNLAGDILKMPVTELEKGLAILGVTLQDIQIPDEWRYYKETDSYYVCRFDAFGVGGVMVTDVQKNPDNTVKIYWQCKYSHWNTATNSRYSDGTKMVMTLQEKTNGEYLIISNVPVK